MSEEEQIWETAGEIVAALESRINGEPLTQAVVVRNRMMAKRIISAAIKAIWESAKKETPSP